MKSVFKNYRTIILKQFSDIREKYSVYWNDEKTTIKIVFLVSILVAILSYYEYIIMGYTSPDGICEGLLYYHNADWHLACGRWFTRYFNLLLGHNIVSPLLVVLEYSIFISLSLLMLKEMFSITGKVELGLLSAVMIASPVVSAQLTYPHVFVAFSGAFFFSVLCCFLTWKGKIIKSLLGVVCVALMMGLYQTYVGAIVVIVLMLAIYELLNDSNIAKTLLRCVKCAVVTVVGCLLNNWLFSYEIEKRGLMAAGRVADFSIDAIFEDIGKSIYKARRFFNSYFLNDSILGKDVLYKILLVVFIIGIVCCFVKMIKRDWKSGIIRSVLIAIIIAVIPVAMNIIYILIPYNKIYILMQYHYVLVFCLLLFVFQWINCKYSLFKFIYTIVMSLLVFSCVLNANATHLAMKASYWALETQTRLILDDVYDVDEFMPNYTKIVFVGYPSEDVVHNSLEIYQFSTGLESNQAFWYGIVGETNCREHYLKNYFGIDPGHITEADYYSVVETDELNQMPVWPQKGSVRMINGMCVVKLTQEGYPVREQ